VPNKFLHVGFYFKKGNKISELEPIFDLAFDWYRYAPTCWILWTSGTAEKWYERLKPKLGADDTFFVCELNMQDRQGWLNQAAWDWLNKKRD
jgi:hypothetical protein